MKKNNQQNDKNLCFTCIFINHYSIIDSYHYLLLFDKTYRVKELLLPFYYTNNEFKEIKRL